jgi:hypothetical protein
MSGPGPRADGPQPSRWDAAGAPRMPDPRMIPRPPADGARRPGRRPEPSISDPSATPSGNDRPGEEAFVRPFYMTGGRTQPVRDGLRLHTIVTAPPSALHAPLRFELRRIVELCQRPLSVAEVAAGLGVPVGVTRVLIADLLSGGYVVCHHLDEETIPLDVIERIAQRVRAL